jgi:hypothetical protein
MVVFVPVLVLVGSRDAINRVSTTVTSIATLTSIIGFINDDNSVYMVGHDNMGTQFYEREMLGNPLRCGF